jgi:imidazole glycerol-phosphate synthase subunit HisH
VIAILDYRAGNLTSVERALQFLNVPCQITSSREEIRRAERIIFPGVGAAGQSMESLEELGLDELIRDAVQSGVPVLGICVGLQVLFDYSEENDTRCLGILPGRVRLFPRSMSDEKGQRLKIPHMGWNKVVFSRPHPVFANISPESEFYFVHSFYPDAAEQDDIIGTTDYGIHFSSAVARGSLAAVQFHPEKSGPPGLKILENFCRWNGRPRS